MERGAKMKKYFNIIFIALLILIVFGFIPSLSYINAEAIGPIFTGIVGTIALFIANK